MKVWIVEEYDTDGSARRIGVYDSPAKADAAKVAHADQQAEQSRQYAAARLCSPLRYTLMAENPKPPEYWANIRREECLRDTVIDEVDVQ